MLLEHIRALEIRLCYAKLCVFTVYSFSNTFFLNVIYDIEIYGTKSTIYRIVGSHYFYFVCFI